jgi:hypothetical protein
MPRDLTKNTMASSYLGEQTITGNGASQAAVLPAGTNTIWIFAEGGAAYYCINGVASANSGGYVPQDGIRVISEIKNLTSLEIFAAALAKVHLQFFD